MSTIVRSCKDTAANSRIQSSLVTKLPTPGIRHPSTQFPRKRAAVTDDALYHHTQKCPRQNRHLPYSRPSKSDKTHFGFDAKLSTSRCRRKERREYFEFREAIYLGSCNSMINEFASLAIEDYYSWSSTGEWRPHPNPAGQASR